MLAVNWNATSNRMYVTNAFCTIRDFHCDSVCIPKCHETERYCSCCCYGDLCNLDNVTQPKPPPSPPPSSTDSPSVIVTSSTKVMTSSTATPSSGVHVIVIAIVATVSGVVFVAAVFVLCFYWWSRSHRDDDDDEDGAGAIALDDMESGGAMASSSSHGGNVDALNPGFDFAAVRKEKHVGIGRFAHVWRVACNDDDDAYAAKIFFDVKSWNSEVDAYVKPPIKHENVLKFVAASAREKDEGETLEYWLVTEYHGMGSLMDHLRSNVVTFGELCGLMKSIARGLAYLHAETTASGSANGTTKAAIAHRDMKSRNVLMKSRSVCCISDLGLAMKFQLGTSLVEAQGQVNQNKIS